MEKVAFVICPGAVWEFVVRDDMSADVSSSAHVGLPSPVEPICYRVYGVFALTVFDHKDGEHLGFGYTSLPYRILPLLGELTLGFAEPVEAADRYFLGRKMFPSVLD